MTIHVRLFKYNHFGTPKDLSCLNSFMAEVPIIWKLIHLFEEQINGLVFIR